MDADRFHGSDVPSADEKPRAVAGSTSNGTANSYVDDEEDKWSSIVQTDDTIANHQLLHEDSLRMMDSVLEGAVEDGTELTVPQPPSQRELTMKEKLVMRERERRIETERARLKRQFALSNGEILEHGADDRTGDNSGSALLSTLAAARCASPVETFGEESIVAHPDEESSEGRQLGFNMERFLRSSDTFNPQMEPTAEGREPPDQGVLMERFLSEPAVPHVPSGRNEPVRSVSFDVVGGIAPGQGGTLPIPTRVDILEGDATTSVDANASTTESLDVNTSVRVEADADDIARYPLSTSTSMDVQENASDTASASAAQQLTEEPRVLRLTEADMQEMAAIEEASIGNAPPSDRDDEISDIVGELADFGVGHHIPADAGGNYSLDTPTTAMDSVSLISGNHSALPISDQDRPYSDQRSLDGMVPRSASSESIEANPPSVSEREDPPTILPDDEAEMQDSEAIVVDSMPDPLLREIGEGGLVDVRYLEGGGLRHDHGHDASNGPAGLAVHSETPGMVDSFNYNKDASSPLPGDNDVDNDSLGIPVDGWSPRGEMRVSPLHPRPLKVPPLQPLGYGAITDDAGRSFLPYVPVSLVDDEEAVPMSRRESEPLLLSGVPPEIITRRTLSEPTGLEVPVHVKTVLSVVESIFSDVRSEDESTKEAEQNDCEKYMASNILARAFPERLLALVVTLTLELPVLFMISGGSTALCELVGRTKYQLLMGFLPLSSAISGNVGLQASTLTTRAISHNQVTSSSYLPWFRAEVGAALCLAVGMGLILGSLAFVASGLDFSFAITIMIAQSISIVTAGCTGTFAPLMFSFIFQRDSGKWGGPLETAIQDIVGSFAMVVISYQILSWIGPGPIDEFDMCVPHSNSDD